MTHRVETILARIETLLTGLATTGARVHRARTLPLDDAGTLPALLIFLGDDEPVTDYSQAQSDWSVDFTVAAIIAQVAEPLDTVLLQIRREVTVALKADYTLGLAFVTKIDELGAPKPEGDGTAEIPAMRYEMLWSVLYQRSWADPGQ